jgi:hypothetical protein
MASVRTFGEHLLVAVEPSQTGGLASTIKFTSRGPIATTITMDVGNIAEFAECLRRGDWGSPTDDAMAVCTDGNHTMLGIGTHADSAKGTSVLCLPTTMVGEIADFLITSC